VDGPGNTTVFAYYASGKLVAEYSTNIAAAQDAKVSYLTNDPLGSPRITTDALGQLVSRRDFMPFGEEIFRTNYGSDSIRQKFTGYERDSETGLDYAKARMFGNSLGRFTSPDYFMNDSRVEDPQSWNEYAYSKNNPLKYTDHSGKTADVEVKINEKNKTGTITIKASIGVYSADKRISEKALKAAASKIQANINGTWKGSFVKDGVTYTVKTEVTVTVYGSETEARNASQNSIGLMKGSPGRGAAALSGDHSFWTGKDAGVWNIDQLHDNKNMPAHEFGHLLGVDDKPGNVLMNTEPSERHSNLTAEDFDWTFGTEIIEQRRNSRYETERIDRGGRLGYRTERRDTGIEHDSYKHYTFSAPWMGMWWKSQ